MNWFAKITLGIIAGILIWQEFVPKLWALSIWGLICFLIIVLSEEVRSFLDDKFSWLMSHILGEAVN
jgi:hypothetical protein